MLAGANAALKVAGKASWCPRRDEAYIGVLVDDLINLGTNEPYRMFTSRAEYRLRLREDNAAQRLTPKGIELGLVAPAQANHFSQALERVGAMHERLNKLWVRPNTPAAALLEQRTGEQLSKEQTLAALLRRPGVDTQAAAAIIALDSPELNEPNSQALQQAAIETKYAGYIKRQEAEIERVRRHESIGIPASLDYSLIEGLSNEMLEKLTTVRPETLARASRIPGITPAALSLLMVHAQKHRQTPSVQPAGEQVSG